MGDSILVLGSSGMAGHVMARFLRETGGLDVVDVGPRRAIFPDSLLVDLENPDLVRKLVNDVKPSAIVNCTGVLVKASEGNKREAAWFNAYLPHLLSECCARAGCRLVHLSTDCVFSGKSGPYTEASYRDGDAFYDRSKALGEVVNDRDLTIRTSIIGPELRSAGTGLFDWAMRQGDEVRGFRRALWSGVTTLELSKFVLHCLQVSPGLSGLVHYSVPGGISKYDLLVAISETFRRGLRITPVDEPVLDKRLICTRGDLGMSPASYRRQLAELRDWMSTRSDAYAKYSEKI